MTDFTLKIMVAGQTQIEERGLTLERVEAVWPLIQSRMAELKESGPVAVLVEPEYGNTTHILGSYR